MKRLAYLGALLLLAAACDNDDNYNDRNGDKAVIPP